MAEKCPRCDTNFVEPPYVLCNDCFAAVASRDVGRSPVVNQTVEEWRQERRRSEDEKLNKWMEVAQSILCVLVPTLGLIWTAFYFSFAEIRTQDSPKMRLRGAICAAYMVLGVIIYTVLYKLYLNSLFDSL